MTSSRAAAAVAALAGPLLVGPLCLPAFALQNGAQPDPGMPILEVIGVFVAIPLGLFALISLLVVAPNLLHRPRYRPGRPWLHDPIWFAGPEQPEAALRAADPGLQPKGGVGANW